MTKKLSRGFSDFFSEFSIEELKHLINLDWPKIIIRTIKFNERYDCCQNCGNKKPEYSFNLKHTDKGKTYNSIYLDRCCSLNCLRRYLNKNIKNNELHNHPPYLGSGFKNKVIQNLVWCLEPKELKQLNKKKILTLTKERIKNYEDAQKCNYCGKKDQKLRFDILKVKKNSSSGLAYGDFCSKECLKKYVEEKV